MSVYYEDNFKEFGVEYKWESAKLLDSVITHRGTKIEMVERPKWGLACYMDNSIQSALIDERIYHEALVHPVMSYAKKRSRIMIVGGGEGATAREVLKWSGVERVDMYEWDKDVVNLFITKYPEWAKGAWNDERLRVHNVDIFETIENPPTDKYDIIIIDLFEPCEENRTQWAQLFKMLPDWLMQSGLVVLYAGMRNILEKEQPYKKLIDLIDYKPHIIPYRVFIPSFSGESMFLLLLRDSNKLEQDFKEAELLNSHITNDVWNSYKTLNW